MKKLLLVIGVVAVLAGIGTSLSASQVDNRRNCTASAIVKCGTFNQSELNKALNKDTKAIFSKYGVSTNLSTAKNGILKSDGRVMIGKKVVATNAQTLGREHRSGSVKVKINGKTYYQHAAKVAFPNDTPVFVFLNTDGSFKSALAKVCGNPITANPTPVPAYTCKALSVSQVSRTSFKFKTSYSVKNATYKGTTYVVKDSKGKQVYKGSNANYTQKTAGTYTVTATITVVADGKTKTATSKACAATFTVKPEVKDIKVCDLTTKKIITIKENAFDSKKHSKNLDDCKEVVKNIEVCELDTKEIITINEKDFDSAKHSTDLTDCDEVVVNIEVCELDTKKIVTIDEKDFDESKYSKDLADCEEKTETIEVCDLDTKTIVTIDKNDFDDSKHSTDMTKCEDAPVTPVTPTELPTTGPTEMVASGLGVGAIIAAASYYVASRRSLLAALLGN